MNSPAARIPTRNATRIAGSPASRPEESPDAPATREIEEVFKAMDKLAFAAGGRLTGGLSLMAFQAAWLEWAGHLAMSPGKQMFLQWKAMRKMQRLLAGLADPDGTAGQRIEPLPHDRRFAQPEWQKPPFSAIWQSFLLTQQWWHNATTDVEGVSHQSEQIVEFASRQFLDMMSPSNFLPTNPVALSRAVETRGLSLLNGFRIWMEDLNSLTTAQRGQTLARSEDERRVALTPGTVVYRNRLMELIQYAPRTPQVHATPLLLIPAWIMKYYILDLTPESSLIDWLVRQGFTVFCISWKNPDKEDRDLGFDDYRRLGVMAAVDEVARITGAPRMHALGYCLGGTLLTVTAAAMARDGDDRLASLTILAGQADFSEAGELTTLTSESQVALLEAMMWARGYLDQRAMAGAFSMLRSQDLIWSRMTREYLMGQRDELSDIAAWSKDTTRMPYRMHSEYLRRLFIGNDLAAGRFEADGRPVYLGGIHLPSFLVGTSGDHIAPWRSVWKMMHLLPGPAVFALASGGHNTGIVSPPDHPKARHRLVRHEADAPHPDPVALMEQAERRGSWWTPWGEWLAAQDPAMIDPPATGPDLGPAPGSYVFE